MRPSRRCRSTASSEGLVGQEAREGLVQQKLETLNGAVLEARTDRIAKETLYNQLASLGPGQIESFPLVLSSPQVQALKTELSGPSEAGGDARGDARRPPPGPGARARPDPRDRGARSGPRSATSRARPRASTARRSRASRAWRRASRRSRARPRTRTASRSSTWRSSARSRPTSSSTRSCSPRPSRPGSRPSSRPPTSA